MYQRTNFDEAEIIRQFEDFMTAQGVRPSGRFYPVIDGKIHRFSTEADRHGEKSGAYRISYDHDWPRWAVQDFRQHTNMVTGKYEATDDDKAKLFEQNDRDRKKDATRTPKEREAEKQRRAEAERQSEEKRQAMKKDEEEQRRAEQEQFSHMAYREYLNADEKTAWTHGYLRERYVSTGLANDIPREVHETHYTGYPGLFSYCPLRMCVEEIHGGFCNRGELLVPMVNVLTERLQTLIRVDARPDERGKYQRRLYPKLSPLGSAFILRVDYIEASPEVFVVEGFGTAIAVFLLTGAKNRCSVPGAVEISLMYVRQSGRNTQEQKSQSTATMTMQESKVLKTAFQENLQTQSCIPRQEATTGKTGY